MIKYYESRDTFDFHGIFRLPPLASSQWGLFFGGEEYAAGLIVDVDGVGAEEIHA